MGCVLSKNGLEEQENDKIERMLRDERNALDFKVLLLGAGESGKSTVVKQLKSVYKVGFDKDELEVIATSLHNNTLTCMQCLIHAAEKFGLEFEGAAKEATMKIGAMDPVQSRLPREVGEEIINLWQNPTIRTCWDRRSEFWILDAAQYYFENCHRFIEEPFSPSEEDCIMARVRTTGILVTEFDDPPVHFRVVDVAGQKGERKKWIHCFDDVKAVLFVVSLSGYNQVMYEDPTKNQMQDALELFQTISNHPAFKTSEFFLFLNKKDLFEEMIRTTDLSKCFPNYTGGSEVKLALEFIENQFKEKMADKTKDLHSHHIAARFKKDIKYSWEEVKKSLVDANKTQVQKAQRYQKNKDKKEEEEKKREKKEKEKEKDKEREKDNQK